MFEVVFLCIGCSFWWDVHNLCVCLLAYTTTIELPERRLTVIFCSSSLTFSLDCIYAGIPNEAEYSLMGHTSSKIWNLVMSSSLTTKRHHWNCLRDTFLSSAATAVPGLFFFRRNLSFSIEYTIYPTSHFYIMVYHDGQQISIICIVIIVVFVMACLLSSASNVVHIAPCG